MKLVTNSTMRITSLPGVWRCVYYFPSNTHDGEDMSAYYVRFEPAAEGLVLHSLPGKSGSYMQAHCTVDANILTGVWLEDTSPKGEFAGKLYSGVFQVIVDESLKHMKGNWVGIGSDSGRQKIYEGRWEIDYAGESPESLPEL
jgi:hypothetical protein